MPKLILLIQTYGVLIVFGTVLVEQMGLPIPAVPILILAGAMAMNGEIAWPLCWAAAVGACLISDLFWFRAGRFYGKRILKLLCRISLSPDICVSQTETKFTRYGVKSLIFSKFIPGVNTVASPLAGALGIGMPRFLMYSITGSLLWSGVGLAIGAYFHKSVDQVLNVLETSGSSALIVLGGLLTGFILYKYVERRRHRASLAAPRISIEELSDLLDGGHDPVIIDARSATALALEQAVPGAVLLHACGAGELMATLDKDRHIVVYCNCPDDVTAAQVAKQFISNGFHRARPLQGGLDAWNAHFSTGKAAENSMDSAQPSPSVI